MGHSLLLSVPTALLTAATALTGAAPADAASAATYQGTWSTVNLCGTLVPGTGRWTVVTRSDGSAVVSLTLFIGQGQLHAAWGGNAAGIQFTQVDPGTNVFDVEGGPLSFVLAPNGTLTYTLTGYPCDGGPQTVWVQGQLR